MEGKPVIQIPQDLIKYEDRILGPLTVTQFLILAGGILVILTLLTAELPRVFTIPLAVVAGVVALIMAFIRVGDVPIYEYLGWLLEYWIFPRQRIWLRKPDDGDAG